MKNKIILLTFLLIVIRLFSFDAGEKLVFTVKYGIISAAEATLQVKEITHKDTIDCWLFSSTSKTKPFFDRIFKVRDKIESIVDKEKFISYKFET